jgi:MoaA/NifB/PqqE/SkfB family radical SAM enzyme
MKNIKYLLNVVYHNFLFWVSRKIDYPLVPPDLVQVNFTFNCNLACKMCSMRERREFLKAQGRQTEIDSDVIKKVIKETEEMDIKTILFIGGEPLLKRDLFDLVSYAKGLKLNAIIVTNGVLLNEYSIKSCFDSGVDWLSISIDAASENTFSKIRGEDVLGKIVQNIRIFNDLKRSAKRLSPNIGAVCTIMNDNFEELLDVVRLCKNLEIERVLFQPVVSNNIDQTQRKPNSPGLIPPERFKILDDVMDELINYKKESLRNFKLVANSIQNLQLIKRYFRGKVTPSEFRCYAGYNRLQIVQEGKVYFCVPQDKYEANFGDIRKETLSNLWFSKEAKIRRKLIRECKVPCLQWCAYREGFVELSELFQKFLFKLRKERFGF